MKMKNKDLLIFGVISLLILSIVLFSGCIGEKEKKPTPTTTVKPETKYVCPDGKTIVLDISQCPTTTTTSTSTTTSTTSTITTTTVRATTTIKPITTTTMGETTTTIPSTPVSLKSFWNVYCDEDVTDLRKDEALRQCNEKKNRYIVESGEIEEIESEGDDIYLKVIHCPYAWNPQASVKMKTGQRAALLKLKKGDTVKYKGILKKCGSFDWFYEGIIVEEGILLQ